MQDRLTVTLPIAGGILRPWTVEDAASYVAARDEEIFRWTTERSDLTVAETEAAIEQVNASEDIISWAIVDEQDKTLLGNITLVYDQEARCAEVMYFLAAVGRGRGLATNAVVAACKWAFENLVIDCVTLTTRVGNARSQRVAIRAGFQRMPNGADHQPDPPAVWFELRPVYPRNTFEK